MGVWRFKRTHSRWKVTINRDRSSRDRWITAEALSAIGHDTRSVGFAIYGDYGRSVYHPLALTLP
jgi:hypothetical protein